jgi:integrase
MPGIARRERIPTTAEVHELLDASHGAVRDYLEFLYETGCRQTEAHRLRAGEVDLAARVCKMNGKTTSRTGKPRVIYLSEPAFEIVSRRLEGLKPGDLVFRNRRGSEWTLQRSRSAFRNLQKRLSLGPHVTAGGIRHWWITERLRAGVPIAHVAELAGHQSTTMIERHYGHLSDHGADLRRALERRAS